MSKPIGPKEQALRDMRAARAARATPATRAPKAPIPPTDVQAAPEPPKRRGRPKKQQTGE